MSSADEAVWMNVEQKRFMMNEIDDAYLLKILEFMCHGGGFMHFLTESKINALFDEAEKRGIKHTFIRLDALQMFGYRLGES